MTHSLKHLIGCALLALVAACGGGSDTPDPPAPPTVPPPVTVTLGATGGRIDGPDGVSLQVPAGALAADTAITIARADASAPPLPDPPAGFTDAGPMMALTPHGTTFSVPVEVSMPLGDLPADATHVLIKTNAADDGWEQIPARVEGDRIVAWITRFSHISRRLCGQPCSRPGPPVITGQPRSGSVNEHGLVLLSVDATGVAPFTYQWISDGRIDLAAERNRAVVINPVTMPMDGMPLRVTVTDALGQATDSQTAIVTVLPAAPLQASGPADVQVVEGFEAVFSAGTTSGIAQTLQWERAEPGTLVWAPVPYPANPTAQNPRLRVPAVTLADDQAQFRLRATNAVGTVTTTAAWLRVLPAPTVPVITQAPVDVTVAAGLGTQFTAQASGGNLVYQWQRSDANGPFVDITQAGDMATYVLSNTSALDNGARFRVRASNSAGSTLSAHATLTVTFEVGRLVTRLSGGARHSMALDASGRLLAWGANDLGQAGRAADVSTVVLPGAVTIAGQELRDVATFSTGANHTLALLTFGAVLRWGSNERGQLELDMSTAFRAEPLMMSDFVISGRGVVAGVQSSGVLQNMVGSPTRVWGMGAVGDGQFHGSLSWTPTTGSPSGLVDIPGLTLVRGSFGVAHSLGIRDDGRVFAWGDNGFGQLGLGDEVARLEPTQLPGLFDVVKVQAGNAHSAALTLDGRVFTWGLNDVNQLGGNAPPNAEISTPRPVPLPAVIIDLACGDNHCLALAFDGRVFGWGGNFYGQVGDGTTADVATPREITGAGWSTRALGIGAGRFHSLAYDTQGSVWAWGSNGGGQLGQSITQITRSTRPLSVPGINLLPGP